MKDDMENTVNVEQNRLLLEIVRDLCADNKCLSEKLKSKVTKMLADHDLSLYSSLHKINAVDENSSAVLGQTKKTAPELTYEEQTELNEAINKFITTRLPELIEQLDSLTNGEVSQMVNNMETVETQNSSKEKEIENLTSTINEKLDTLRIQDAEIYELILDWLMLKTKDKVEYDEHSAQWKTIKNDMLAIKAKIIDLQILQGMYTETSLALDAYRQVDKDLKEGIRELEDSIRKYRKLIQEAPDVY